MNPVTSKRRKATALSRSYRLALRHHLAQGPGADLEPARELGRHAIRAGLETLDLAKIHECAMVSPAVGTSAADTHGGQVGLAGLFFAEAVTPIEQTHRGAREAKSHLNRIVEALSERTLELADSVAELKEEILKRQVVEESLRASELTTSQLLEQSVRMQGELLLLSRQLLSAQEEERRQISRELHDVIGQTLTNLNVRLAALKAESNTSARHLHKQISSAQRLVEESVDMVQRFARELRPSMLDDLGLIPALRSFMKDFMQGTGIRTSLRVSAGIEEAGCAVRTMLYRVVQEALTNVVRHAQATHAEVKIECLDGRIRMTVTDDGQGFQVGGDHGAKPHKRLGMLGMRERVEMLGGTFCVESAPGHATTVRVELPPLTADPPQTSSAKPPPIPQVP